MIIPVTANPVIRVGTALVGGDLTGNVRGAGAFDFQSIGKKTNVNQVAESAYSTIVGGYRQYIKTSQSAVILGGLRAFIKNSANAVTIGSQIPTIFNASGAIIIGGTTCKAYGQNSLIMASSTARAQGINSVIIACAAAKNYGQGAVIIGGASGAYIGPYAVGAGQFASDVCKLYGNYSSSLSSRSVKNFGYGGAVISVQSAGGSQGIRAGTRWSAMMAGRNHTITSSYSAVIGGYQNSVSGKSAVSLAATFGNISAPYSIGSGYNPVVDKPYQISQGMVFNFGGADFALQLQTSSVVMANRTTNNTATELFCNNGASGTLRCTIPTDVLFGFRVLVVAMNTASKTDAATFELKGCIVNNGGTVSLVGTVTLTVIARISAAWTCDAQADNTNKSLKILVTGENGKTIHWFAKVELAEVS